MEVLKGCEVVEVLLGGCQVWWSRWPRVGIQEGRDHFLLHQTSVWWADRADAHLLIKFQLVYLHFYWLSHGCQSHWLCGLNHCSVEFCCCDKKFCYHWTWNSKMYDCIYAEPQSGTAFRLLVTRGSFLFFPQAILMCVSLDWVSIVFVMNWKFRKIHSMTRPLMAVLLLYA